MYNDNAPKGTDNDASDEVTSAPAPEAPLKSQQTKPCRYGSSCTRPDCKFWHPEGETIVSEPVKVDVGAKCASLGLSWIPSSMKLNLHSNGKVTPSKSSSEDEASSIVSVKEYEL